jgi:hypothetical protein
MNTFNKSISIIEPVNEAIKKTKIILFTPFNMEKWFIIGFCAWLAEMFQGSFGGFNPGSGGGDGKENLAKIVEFCKANIIFVVSLATPAIILIAGFIILFLWLSSRGKFMFLDCLAKNKAHVAEPWKTFKKQANSLLAFRLLLIVAGFAYIAVIIAMIIIFAIFLKTAAGETAGVIILLAIMIPLAIICGLCLAIAQTLTFDFVVPIMYLQRIGALAAWAEFLPLLRQNFWKIILYLLFKIVISICIGATTLFIVGISCCCCCIGAVLFIPYIGTVILLPLPSFYRLYSLCFIQQFGIEYDVFLPEV